METDAARELAAKVADLREAEEALIEAQAAPGDDVIVNAAEQFVNAVRARNRAYDVLGPTEVEIGDRASGVVKEQPIGGQS